MIRSTRLGSLLGLSALMAITCMTAAIVPANAAQTHSKTVHVKRHMRLDLNGYHNVAPYTKTTRSVNVTGYTKHTKNGKAVHVNGYRRKMTTITPDKHM